jgi:perosamine synthetase
VIPLFRPSVSPTEIRNVTQVLESGWWGLGPRTAEFEARFSSQVVARHGIGVSSCTAALHLALEALDVRGGEVIVPALTFASTALGSCPGARL